MPAIDPNQQLVCAKCASPDVDGRFLRWFGVCVCDACKREHPDRFGLCTKTEAREDFLLTDSEVDKLPHVLRPNPHNPNWKDMKLFLLEHVHELAMKKYGSEQGLEQAFEAKRHVRHKKQTKQLTSQLQGAHRTCACVVADTLRRRPAQAGSHRRRAERSPAGPRTRVAR